MSEITYILADDQKTFWLEIKRACRKLGLGKVDSFLTGTEMLEAIKKSDVKKCLLDWNLTTTVVSHQKVELIQKILEVRPEMKIIIISGSKHPSEVGEARAAGAVAWAWKLAPSLTDVMEEVADLDKRGWVSEDGKKFFEIGFRS